MNIESISAFGFRPETAGSLAYNKKPEEMQPLFGQGAETAGSLAAGNSLNLIA